MKTICKVTIVSDGIVVEFEDATICYFSAETLHSHRAELHGQLLLDHDPSLDESVPVESRKSKSASEECFSSGHQLYQPIRQNADARLGRHRN